MDENHAAMMVDGHRILPALLEDLASARHSVHLSMFLFFRDSIGEEIAAVPCRRAEAGVVVRVLLNMEKIAMGDPFLTGERRIGHEDLHRTLTGLRRRIRDPRTLAMLAKRVS